MAIDYSMWDDVLMTEEDEGPLADLRALALEDAAGELEPMDVDQPDHVGDHIQRVTEAAMAQLGDKVGQE